MPVDAYFGAPGMHNLRVYAAVALLFTWAMSLVHRFKELRLMEKLHEDVQSAVDMPRMGRYLDELQQLTWNHFSQLWRMQLSPRCPVSKVNVAGHLQSESLEISEAPAAAGSGGRVVEFLVDAAVDVTVAVGFVVARAQLQRLLSDDARNARSGGWLRGAAVELETRATEDRRPLAASDCAALVEERVEAGRNRRVRVTGPPRGAADTGAVPLVVLILPASDRSWGGELTVCNSRDVSRQLVLGDPLGAERRAWDVQGIYGFEHEDSIDCMVCFENVRDVVLLPCRHCCCCRQCLRSLREDKCPLCRVLFHAHVALPVKQPNGSMVEQ